MLDYRHNIRSLELKEIIQIDNKIEKNKLNS